MKQYHLYPGPNRERPFLAVMLTGWPDLTDYISIAGDVVTIEYEDSAGSGAAFILAAFASLFAGEPLHLSDIAALDGIRFPIFLAALRAWYDGEVVP